MGKGVGRGRTGSRGAQLLPVAYLLVAMALALAVLPSALRPPPDEASASAQLSPDAPPDAEAETIIQSLQQAASRTAGASGSGEPPPTTTAPPLERQASRGQCFGDPPRQTESAYAPPCRPAFTGDNGGATWTNVTGDEVRVGFWHALGMPRERGPISDDPPPGESAVHRTVRVIQAYFNERYELSGRRLRLVAIEDDGPSEEEQRASALHEAEVNRLFAAVHLNFPFCDELTRRQLMCFNGNGFQDDVYEEHSPFWWSYQMGLDKVDRMVGEYVCKKLVGRTADFARGVHQGRPRRIGYIVESWANNRFRTYETIRRSARDHCGFDEVHAANVNPEDPAQIGSALAQMRANDVTTIVNQTGLVASLVMWSAADSQGYFPEWVMLNSYGMDFGDGARLTGSRQLDGVFGMSGWELPRRFQETDCYRAYKSIDPANAPDQNWCRLNWISVEHIVNGIQEAGPNLTPETFRDGLYDMPLQEVRGPWAIGGGYGPGDHSFVDDLAEIWWDSSCVDPDGGEPGCYQHTEGGRRWRPGELDDVVRVFNREGSVAGYEPGPR